MNYLLNEAFIKEQMRAARRTQFWGVGLVFLSFIASLFLVQYPILVFFSYPALIVGFPMWQIGRGRTRRWSEEIKVPARVAAELKGVSTKHALYAYFKLPNGPAIDYLIVGPDGFYVIEMKTGGFPVTCIKQNGKDRWSEKLPMLERLARLGDESLGNPTAALDGQIEALKGWLADNKLAAPTVPIYGVIVFREPKTTLEADDAEYEALLLDELKSFIMTPVPEEESVPGSNLPTDARNRIAAAIRTLIGDGAQATPAATTTGTPSSPAKAATPAKPSINVNSTKRPPTATASNGGARPAPTARTSAPPSRANSNGASEKRGSSGQRKGS